MEQSYKEKYEQAIERARVWKDKSGMPKNKQGILDDIFPELAESEDEKVRKELIKHLKELSDWKEDEVIPVKNPSYYRQWASWLEKQGEQSLANKVELKYHEGEWITNGDYTWKIVEVKPLDYILQSQDGNVVDDTISHVDEQFHSFTIQDAKDGDVLCDYHEAYDNPLIFILKKFEHVNFGLVRPSDYSSYCFLTAGDIQKFKEGTYHHEHNIKPATKEQHDLLFQKMHEAGYEWDAEKKELKKFHVIDEGKSEMDYCFTKMMNGEKISSAWSEEEERYIRQLETMVKDRWALAEKAQDEEVIKNMSNLAFFLKTFNPNKKPADEDMKTLLRTEYEKGRADAISEMQKEWSEETDDDAWMNDIISKVENNLQLNKAEIDWLKSHRPQNRWKPSDEQMWCLSDAIEHYNSLGYLAPKLKELYEQLKKL